MPEQETYLDRIERQNLRIGELIVEMLQGDRTFVGVVDQALMEFCEPPARWNAQVSPMEWTPWPTDEQRAWMFRRVGTLFGDGVHILSTLPDSVPTVAITVYDRNKR